MELPLLLAGPILRRVDPGLVSVWTAFSSPAEVTLEVFEGRVAYDTTNPVFASSADPPDPNAPPPFPGAEAIRVGEHLYLSLVSARLPPASGKVFESDRLYSYNLWIEADGGTNNLHSLKLLETHQVSGTTAEPLGYADRMLPSFALPPSQLDDLQLAYGSCRRVGYDDGDAFAWMDEYLAERVGDPRARLHQLFLGGDQIYADDVENVLMQRVVELGVELIGTAPASNPLAGEPAQTPIERIAVGKVRLKKGTPDPKDPDAAYADEPTADTLKNPLPAGPPWFGIGNRLYLTNSSAQLTSEDGKNHLISLGEFAATYLLYWSPACWGTDIPRSALKQNPDAAPSGTVHWLDVLTGEQSVDLPDPGFPARVPQYFFKTAQQLADDAKKDAEGDPATTKHKKALASQRHQRVHRQFLANLWRAQRLLANVPTYMILDDHDVTDDYFLTPMWRHRVLGSALGQTILTNAMIAYALFQDWGNDPRRYDVTSLTRPELGGQLPGDLLVAVPKLFPDGTTKGPDAATFTALAKMFGHDLDNQPLPNGQFLSVKPPLTWHFTIDGPKHRVVALDNRTRRSYVSEIGPPGNVSKEALDDQIPKPPLPAGVEVLVVIAPLQVIGPPVLDEVVGRAIYKIFDAVHYSDVADATSASGTRLMPGTNPDALETWALDENTFEYLMSRLADYKRVVLLSGDVHNAASNLMSYWRGDSTSPARIAQFTSSGFKNVMPVYLQALDAKMMALQQMLRARLGVERLGWTRPDANLVLLPSGRSEDDLVAVTRAKLLRSPVLLPTWGWIDDNPPGETDPAKTSRLNPAKPPEWRWRVTPLLDERPDADRPSPIRAFPLDDAQIETQAADPATTFAALRAVAVRHQHALERMRNTRQMMFRSNFGLCRFESDGDAITAVGEVYTEAIDPDTQLPVMGAYMVHRAPLGPLTEDPPQQLRRFALESVPIPEPTP